LHSAQSQRQRHITLQIIISHLPKAIAMESTNRSSQSSSSSKWTYDYREPEND